MKMEIPKVGSRSQSRLSRSNSEFAIVVNPNNRTSYGSKCINTIDQLNEFISNGHSVTEKQDELSPLSVSVTSEDVRHHTKPLLVELVPYPGFDDSHPTPLPGNLQPMAILKDVISAQSDLRVKSASFKCSFNQFFLSLSSQRILQDSFWWYFCHKYHSKSTSCQQEKIFNRLAAEYTKFLLTWTNALYKDKFFIKFTNMMSQAVYATFYRAFLASYLQFDADFCDEVIALLYLWMMGTKPAPRLWEKWNFEVLQAKNLPRVPKSNTKKGDMVEKLLQHLGSAQDDPTELKRSESCVAGRGASFHQVVFDIHGRSPFVEHCLTSYCILPRTGSSTILQRTEIKSLPPLSAQTYKDVVQNVRCKSRDEKRKFTANSSSFRKQQKFIEGQNKLEVQKFSEYANSILSNRQEVRKMSALLRIDDRNEDKGDEKKLVKRSTYSPWLRL